MEAHSLVSIVTSRVYETHPWPEHGTPATVTAWPQDRAWELHCLGSNPIDAILDE